MPFHFDGDRLITNSISVGDASHHRIFKGYDIIMLKANFTTLDSDFDDDCVSPAFAVGRDGYIICICPSYPMAVKLINSIIIGKSGDQLVDTP